MKKLKKKTMKEGKKKGTVEGAELEKLANITQATRRYWTDNNLLVATQKRTRARYVYQLQSNLKRIDKIQKLKKQGCTLDEIKKKLGLSQHTLII